MRAQHTHTPVCRCGVALFRLSALTRCCLLLLLLLSPPGMRAVKSVLVMAGQLKRKSTIQGEEEETLLLIRAMRDSNVPKFLEQDLPLFKAIISDLFPSVVVPFVDYGTLQVAIEAALVRQKLQVVPTFVTKVLQLYETCLVRHGVMLVGLPMSGKSTCAAILAEALGALSKDHELAAHNPYYREVVQSILNPKSISMNALYGAANSVGEWQDGLVPWLVRKAVDVDASAAHPSRQWIQFDGPVDAIWIENMNTVLDDNKMLCLNNGERIKLKDTITLVTHTHTRICGACLFCCKFGPESLTFSPLAVLLLLFFVDVRSGGSCCGVSCDSVSLRHGVAGGVEPRLGGAGRHLESRVVRVAAGAR